MSVESQSGREGRGGTDPGRCAFTVDLEEYFEVKMLRDYIRPAEWDSLPARANRSVEALLGFLSRHEARATFFVSPWVAEARPGVVRNVAAEGHETAVLARMPRTDVPADRRREVWSRVVEETRDRLEQLTARPVLGCRSVRFRHPLPAGDAIEILAEKGFRYDATLSRELIRSTFDGDPAGPGLGACRLPTSEGTLLAAPPSTFGLFGRRLFTVGRTAFRVLPFRLTSRVLERDAVRTDIAVFSMRSWEMDPAQPTLPVSLVSRVRLYWGLQRVPSRLERLLREFPFGSVADVLGLDAPEMPARSEKDGMEGRRGSPRRSRRVYG